MSFSRPCLRKQQCFIGKVDKTFEPGITFRTVEAIDFKAASVDARRIVSGKRQPGGASRTVDNLRVQCRAEWSFTHGRGGENAAVDTPQVKLRWPAKPPHASVHFPPPRPTHALPYARSHRSGVLRSSRESVGMIPACPPRTTQFDGHQVVGLLYGLDLMIWWRVSHNLY